MTQKNRAERGKIELPDPIRALNFIEKLALFYHDTNESHKTAEKIIDQIYTYAHLFGGCKNKHENWREDFYKEEKALKDY